MLGAGHGPAPKQESEMSKQVKVSMSQEEAESLFFLAYGARVGGLSLEGFKPEIHSRIRNDEDDLVQRLFAASEASAGEADWDGDSPMDAEQAAKWVKWAAAQGPKPDQGIKI